ncbi:MAG: FtsX-like permease family protein [Candidatus Thorarchaeota archaeon]
MSEQDYASQDLKRRPFRSTLILISLTSVVATTTFLFLFSNVMLDVTSAVTSTGLSSALSVFFETFIWFTLILVLVLGGVVVSSNISLEMISRRKDIGLMKSIGTLIDTIFDHFMAQAIILLLAGLTLGIAIGTMLYFAGLFWLSMAVPGFGFTFIFPWLQLGLIVLIFLFVGYYAAQKPIYDIVRESPIAAMNPDVGMKVRRVGYLDTFGLAFRLATKATGRQIKGTRRTILSLFLSFTLASVIWIGGGVVETTTDAYVVRSMGSNVVAVGNPDLLEQYYESYSLSGNPLSESFSFLNSSDIITPSVIASISDLSEVIHTEQRLVDYVSVAESSRAVWVPNPDPPPAGFYELIGGNRSSLAPIVGIDWDNTLSDWYFEGERINTSRGIWVGGEMAQTMFVDPLAQRLGVMGSSFEVQGIAFDILNGGMMAMMELSEMQNIWSVTGANLLLIQLSSYDTSTIAEIEQIAQAEGFGIFLQQEYLLISVFGRFRDYVIMRSIGAKPSFIARTMVAEGVDIGLKAGLPAVFVGITISVLFLVPEAAVPSLLYLPATVVIMLVSLILVVFLAAIPVYLLFASRSDLRVSEFAV